MDISCDNCQSKFKISDDKIPPGKTAILKCPKCKNKISVTGKSPDPPAPQTVEQPEEPEQSQTAFGFEEEADASYDSGIDLDYDSADKPFDFVEEEGKTAIICEADPSISKAITGTLELLEYHVSLAENARDALKKMRYHEYDMVVVNEKFDTKNPDANGVLIYLERLMMNVRRNIFVVLISDRFRTQDNMIAFVKSVNLVINTSNLDKFETILTRGITDYEFFYRVFKEELKNLGLV